MKPRPTAAGLLLTGCASAPTLDEIWPETRQQVVDAESVHLVIDATSGEAQTDASPTDAAASSESVTSGHVDLAGATDHSYLQGSATIDMGGTDMHMQIVALDQEAYVKVRAGDDAPAGMDVFRAIVGDRWMKTAADEDTGFTGRGLSGVISDLEEDMPAADAFDGMDLAPENVELDGEEYLKYVLPEEHQDFGRAIYVDPESQRLHRIEGMPSDDASTGDPTEGTATFTDWNAVQRPEAPKPEDVVDMDQLSQLTG